jgi:hypothetical protein
VTKYETTVEPSNGSAALKRWGNRNQALAVKAMSLSGADGGGPQRELAVAAGLAPAIKARLVSPAGDALNLQLARTAADFGVSAGQ